MGTVPVVTFRIRETSWYWETGLGAGVYDYPHDVEIPVVTPSFGGGSYTGGGNTGGGYTGGGSTGGGFTPGSGSQATKEPEYEDGSSDIIYAEIRIFRSRFHFRHEILRKKHYLCARMKGGAPQGAEIIP